MCSTIATRNPMKRAIASLSWLAALTIVSGCGESKPADETATPSSTPKTETTADLPKTKPTITVDAEGPFINGERIKLGEAGGPEKLQRVVSEFPIEGEQVTLITLKDATTPDVVAVVREFGKAGAPTVNIKTDGRDDKPNEVVFTPQSRAGDAPGCSIATMILENLSTAVWAIEGGVGKKHTKGYAGPDFSNTEITLGKQIPECESSTAFVSAHETVPWEMTHNLAGSILTADEEKRIKTVVLLDEAPVAGRKVDLGS